MHPWLTRIPLVRRPFYQRDIARLERDQAIRERDRAIGEREAAIKERDEQRMRRPQGMLELTLQQFVRREAPATVRSVAVEALAIQRERGSRAATDFLLDRVGFRASPDRNEAYFAQALHFHLGLLHAHAGDPEQMAEHLRLSGSMPTGEDDSLFSDQINVAQAMRAQQVAAMERGIPSILIACMPRSASATLTYTIGRALQAPVMHVSAGRFPDYFLVPSWLDMFLEGGAITQDHFGANPFNVGVLHGRGPRDIFVLVRDPRAAARSRAHFQATKDLADDGPLDLRIRRECVENFIPWLQGWIDCSRAEHPFRVHWLSYREVREGPAAVLGGISAILAPAYPALASLADRPSPAEVRMHFVSGDDDAWKEEVSRATRDLLWEACTPDIKSLLKLAW
jgi:hypothetical protein